jgi:hypothetical protein
MKYKSGNVEVDVYFLQEHHLNLLESCKLDIQQLPYLPMFKDVADEDLLDWLSFQRAVEKQYCGFKSTTYDFSNDITVGNINREGVVYKAKYDEVLNGDRSVILGSNYYYYFFNGCLYILNSSNTVNTNTFKNVQGDLASSLYQALLSTFSTFETYFRECEKLTKTVSERKSINLGFVLSKVLQ